MAFFSQSRPPRARGLKHLLRHYALPIWTSRPPRARGLKPGSRQTLTRAPRSRPPRARGLKPLMDNFELGTQDVAPPAGAWIETWLIVGNPDASVTSRPPRARGLKLAGAAPISLTTCVAPPAGAWIETRRGPLTVSSMACRAPRGRVD